VDVGLRSEVSVRSNRKDVLRRSYAGEVDAFAVWCPQNQQAYFIPVDDLASGIGSLRVEATANDQRRGVRWAADYALPDPATEPRTGFEPATPVLQERCSTS
jgi:PD-(D/E)XK endonuclease